MQPARFVFAALVLLTSAGVLGVLAEEDPDLAPAEAPIRLGPMTLEALHETILKVDAEAVRSEAGNAWQLTLEERQVTVVTDLGHDRMRIFVPIAPADGVSESMIRRLMQANFDTALDARYAIAQDILWGTFIHPLSPLTERQLLSGVGQTVNLARTYGTTFSSGALSYGGGDSQGLMERELIDRLLEKETPI